MCLTSRLTALMVIAIFLGYNKPKKKTNYKQALQGDWATPNTARNRFKTDPVFSFRGSKYRFTKGSLKPYSLKSDTLIVNADNSYNFKILQVDQDSLYLQALPIDSNKKFTFWVSYDELDTFKLVKIKPKHETKIKIIGFYSTHCFGQCPVQYFELDSIGNMLFWGQDNTKPEGFFSGKIPDSVVLQIKRSIHNILLDSLRQNYFFPGIAYDCPYYGFKLVTADEEFKTIIHCGDDVPVELRFLINDLMELYKSADLKMDSTVRDKKQLLDFGYKLKRPPMLYKDLYFQKYMTY